MSDWNKKRKLIKCIKNIWLNRGIIKWAHLETVNKTKKFCIPHMHGKLLWLGCLLVKPQYHRIDITIIKIKYIFRDRFLRFKKGGRQSVKVWGHSQCIIFLELMIIHSKILFKRVLDWGGMECMGWMNCQITYILLESNLRCRSDLLVCLQLIKSRISLLKNFQD